MISSILLTKLFPPPTLPRHIQREYLIQRLNDGLAAGKSITLVSAPAGFGKTTCISSWISQLDLPVTWLSLDAADDHPVRFFTYFVAALQHVDENLGWEIEGVLRAGELPPAEVVSAALVNDVLQSERRFVLVLDDFQMIQTQMILTVLEALITNLPQVLHLVLVTREDPSLPLARLRANGLLTEIRAADLRFSRAETEQFLSTMALSLSPPDVSALEGKTEGWVAGLQLAALAMQQHDPSSFIADLNGSHRHILSYLSEEVLNQQSEAIKCFLLQTAVLDQLNGDLCDAITGRTDSQALLEELFNANLFLFPLDDERCWYRYHHLFADLLRDLLSRRGKAEMRNLHRRASRWYAQAGMINEAIQHALAAEDRALTIEWVETYAMDILMQWYVKTVENWLQAIPAEWRFESVKAALVFAWVCYFNGDFAEAAVYAERVAALTSDDPSLRAEWLALQSSLLNLQGKAEESLRLSEEALQIAPEQDAYVRILIYLGRAGAYQQMDEYDRAVAAYRSIITYGKTAGSLISELFGISGLGLLEMHHGHLHTAFELASQGVDRIERAGVLPPISTGIYGELGQIYYEWHQLEQADHYFRRSIQVCTLTSYSDAEMYYAVIHARLFQGAGDLESAGDEIQRAVELMQTTAPAAVREEIMAQQVRVYLGQGRLAEAERVLGSAGFVFTGALSMPDLSTIQNSFHPAGVLYNSALRIVLYRARTKGEIDGLRQGIELASRRIDDMLRRDYLLVALETLLIRAEMYATLGDTCASLDDYARALVLAEPEGFISVFVEEGQPVKAALRTLLRQEHAIPTDYIEGILAAYADSQPSKEDSSLIEPLTERERDVLRLMADGLKYQEIADRLFISLNTVRFYVKEIYSKLGVNNRTRALQLAAEQHVI